MWNSKSSVAVAFSFLVGLRTYQHPCIVVVTKIATIRCYRSKMSTFYTFKYNKIKISEMIPTDCFPCCECRKMNLFATTVRVKAHRRTICLSWLIFDNQKQQFKWIQNYTRLFHDKLRPTKQIKLRLPSTNDALSWPLRHHYSRQ